MMFLFNFNLTRNFNGNPEFKLGIPLNFLEFSKFQNNSHYLWSPPFIIKKMCFSMGFNTNQSQSQVEWNSFVEFRSRIWAHECLKMFFSYNFFTSFLLSCNTPKMAMKMCSFSAPNHNSVPARRTHSRRARTHTRRTRRSYSEEEPLSRPDKKDFNGSCGDLQASTYETAEQCMETSATSDGVSMTKSAPTNR